MSSKNIEVIEWIDSGGHDGWNRPSKEADPLLCISIGVVVLESKTGINVVSTWQDNEWQYHSELTIPKVAVRERTVIKTIAFGD